MIKNRYRIALLISLFIILEPWIHRRTDGSAKAETQTGRMEWRLYERLAAIRSARERAEV